MAQKLKGVGGVLGSLISEPSPAVTSEPADETVHTSAIEQSASSVAGGKVRPAAPAKTQARRGRPPGKKAGEAADKEKMTVRLSSELMEDYRDWSWEERCQLGELVERAMIHYRKNRNRQKSQ